MGLTAPYSTNPIKMASAAGSGTITFKKMQEPKILPNFQRTRMQTMSYTRPSATSPGNRIFGSLGSQEGFWDLHMELPFVYPNDFQTLLGWYMSRPGVVLVSIDGGITRYYAIWKENGLQETCYSLNQREFYKVNIELMLIGVAGTTFDNMEEVV